MSTLEILLLVAGGLAFISSFFLPDGKKGGNAEISEEELRARVDEAIENSRARIDDMSEESIRYSMERTERALDKITNEKMMALGEYSDSIMNQIAQNHQETVFLHDMLNRSKDELAELLNRAEKASKDADKRANDAYDLARNAEKLAEEVQARVEESSRAAMAAEEKMIDARRMLQEMPVRREELSTQATPLVRAVEKQAVEKQAAEEAGYAAEAPISIVPAELPDTTELMEDLADEPEIPEVLTEEELPSAAGERSAYEEITIALASPETEDVLPAEDEYDAAEGSLTEEAAVYENADVKKEEPAEEVQMIREAPVEEEKASEEIREEELSEEEKMERILQAAAAELAGERRRPLPAARKTRPVEEVKEIPKELPKEEPQPVVESHSAAQARALLESVSKSPALGEDFAGGKRPVAGERISRTSVKRKPRNSVKRSALQDAVKGQMSIPDEFLSQKEVQKEPAPRAKEAVTLQFAPGENSANHNERILQMHRMGRSNMAIAKDLGLGIGEVKLVIDLYENMQ